jgi:hypothetical protein
MLDPDTLTGYTVDPFGTNSHAAVLEALVREADLDGVQAAIAEYGLEAVAEQYLRGLLDEGRLHADEAAALAEEERRLADDPQASPEVHAVTVADLADEFTRLGLIEPMGPSVP